MLDLELYNIETMPPGPSPANIAARPYAQVTYGSDGSQSRFKMDLGFGCRCWLVASFVTALVSMEPPPPPALSGTMFIGGACGAVQEQYIQGLAKGVAKGLRKL